MIKLDPENLHANEIGVAKVKEQLDPIKEVDCMIAVGSGTVHDLTDIMHMKERFHLSQFQPQQCRWLCIYSCSYVMVWI